MFHKILVPLDGSKFAERAIPHAVRFAKAFHASITLLQVLDPDYRVGEQQSQDPLKWRILKIEAESYLQSVVAEAQENWQSVDYQILEGRTADRIVDYAQSSEIDLVVLSTHGQGGLSRWSSSSIVHKVIQKVMTSVLLVRAYETAPSESWQDYRRILLPIDCSRRGECALPAAIPLAKQSQARLLLAHVLKRPYLPFLTPHSEEVGQLINRFMEISEEAAAQYLAELSSRTNLPAETRLVAADSILDALYELIEQESDLDLVILCAHGQSGIPRWSYGTVAGNLIENASVHTLVIQDVPRSQLRPSAAEIAATEYSRR